MSQVIDHLQRENRPGTAGSYRNTNHSFAAYLTRNNLCHGILSYERHKTGCHIEMEILPEMQHQPDTTCSLSYGLYPLQKLTTNTSRHYASTTTS